jgi:flagellar basal-body rod modification protein FlgD
MAVDSLNTITTSTNLDNAPAGTNPDGILGKDDFMKLLLIELKYQDPTEPMDSEKILTQTSQLATLEASDNTNTALENLSKTLAANRDFSTIAAIGKIADTGSNAVVVEDGTNPNFEIYYPNEVQSGTVEIRDANGNIISTITLEGGEEGVTSFEWDGRDDSGNSVDDGFYYVTSTYNDVDGIAHETRVGLYPIESVRFDEDETMVKLGSEYWSFDAIKEVLEG